MRNHRDLVVWKRSHRLVLRLYRLTDDFPRPEVFGLTSQIRRAAVSIPTNLAEGCGRWGDGDIGRFVKIAMGSASEVDYLTFLGAELGYVSSDKYTELATELTEVRGMLTGFYKRIRTTNEHRDTEKRDERLRAKS